MTYGNLQPILSPPILFHLVTIDFILALPLLHTGKDNLMIVTYNFAKRILLIPGYSKWGPTEWVSALLEHLQVGEWGLPKVIISDQVKKFLSAL